MELKGPAFQMEVLAKDIKHFFVNEDHLIVLDKNGKVSLDDDKQELEHLNQVGSGWEKAHVHKDAVLVSGTKFAKSAYGRPHE